MRAVLLVLLATACNPFAGPKTPPGLEAGAGVCINDDFLTVKDVSRYPWVALDSNQKCNRPGTPSTVLDFSTIHSFQPDCTCRYSYACRQKCKEEHQPNCLDDCKE